LSEIAGFTDQMLGSVMEVMAELKADSDISVSHFRKLSVIENSFGISLSSFSLKRTKPIWLWICTTRLLRTLTSTPKQLPLL